MRCFFIDECRIRCRQQLLLKHLEPTGAIGLRALQRMMPAAAEPTRLLHALPAALEAVRQIGWSVKKGTDRTPTRLIPQPLLVLMQILVVRGAQRRGCCATDGGALSTLRCPACIGPLARCAPPEKDVSGRHGRVKVVALWAAEPSDAVQAAHTALPRHVLAEQDGVHTLHGAGAARDIPRAVVPAAAIVARPRQIDAKTHGERTAPAPLAAPAPGGFAAVSTKLHWNSDEAARGAVREPPRGKRGVAGMGLAACRASRRRSPSQRVSRPRTHRRPPANDHRIFSIHTYGSLAAATCIDPATEG